MVISPNENLGEKFNLDSFLKARSAAILIVQSVAAKVTEDMSEDQAHDLLKSAFEQNGSQKLWHPTKVRFGVNTLKTFREISEPDIKIKNGDVFFFDIGPVIDDHEGDYGETFVCGENKKNDLAQACQDVFSETAHAWKEQNLSGPGLYAFAARAAEKRGYQLNLDMDGHRLGDFPHALHFKGGLPDHADTPNPNLWILEIHLRDVVTNRGAFFEDLLQ
ncbi:MAG: (Fe-S)-binding protein [Bdellovibrionales bacterium CG12_big_fil_rev_8_21_14_0_65_38_15]|nr:MAG: (Fe-S)-binding protein [Bdellovibrionales bacterium CG22_combo_CG10-13_8_21_14_all_38_13]PIQ53490.1 MAG: (Fe-S)-binding protein [Bdellovibrionales bacterium CG12_big_fil_rev_8_21_14_0_65_38_15]PIR28506.1 MAG: (Fe-S)-binding protein [Bdellovibrionales bacterium CG11_big_fil_rev_8_21_14_0_20_38_13]